MVAVKGMNGRYIGFVQESLAMKECLYNEIQADQEMLKMKQNGVK